MVVVSATQITAAAALAATIAANTVYNLVVSTANATSPVIQINFPLPDCSANTSGYACAPTALTRTIQIPLTSLYLSSGGTPDTLTWFANLYVSMLTNGQLAANFTVPDDYASGATLNLLALAQGGTPCAFSYSPTIYDARDQGGLADGAIAATFTSKNVSYASGSTNVKATFAFPTLTNPASGPPAIAPGDTITLVIPSPSPPSTGSACTAGTAVLTGLWVSYTAAY